MTELQKQLINMGVGGSTISLADLESDEVSTPLRNEGVYDFHCDEVLVGADYITFRGRCTKEDYDRVHSIQVRAYGDGTFFRAQMEDILLQIHNAPVGFKLDLIKDVAGKDFVIGASYSKGYINYTFNVKQLVSMLQADIIK